MYRWRSQPSPAHSQWQGWPRAAGPAWAERALAGLPAGSWRHGATLQSFTALVFGKHFGKAPVLVGKEEPTAWLTNTSQAVKLFGQAVVDTAQLIKWTADWVKRDMPSLGKPTKYEVRDGRY